jgi:hypothetical protein
VENDISMNIFYKTHACLSSSSNNVENYNLVCDLVRKENIFYALLGFDDIEIRHCKVMVMSGSLVINSKSEPIMKNETFHREVMVISNSHFVSFQSENDDISLKKTFSTKHNSKFSNYDHDEVCT